MESFNVRPLLFALLLASATPASASVVLKQSVEAMTRTAEVVIHGIAGPSVSQWNAGKTHIETWTDFEVTETLKGKTDKSIRVKQPGGVVEGMGQSVVGAATFSPGEEVLLFLERAPEGPGSFVLQSLAYAKVSLEKNHFGERRAVRDPKGLSLYDPNAPHALHALHTKEDLGSDQEFLARVRQAVKASKVAPRTGR